MRSVRFTRDSIRHHHSTPYCWRFCLWVMLTISWPTAWAASSAAPVEGQPFSRDTVVELAQKLSETPYRAAQTAPPELGQLDYDTYRKINFVERAAIWGNSPTQFSVQLFAPGYLFKDLVDIHVVENGKSYPVVIGPSSFKVPYPALGELLAKTGKFAGMRLHFRVNSDAHEDEFIAFQGASYFRAVSKGQAYGLSARGLAIDVGQPTGEEFPLFKQYWIERPSNQQQAIVVHALLDSKRITGAFRFGIYPGSPTTVDTEVTLFARADIMHLGLAPLTSMFMHGPMDHADRPDYRPAVHDSDALVMLTGSNEHLWRPLNNPQTLQVSDFMDDHPKGFGLIQPQRDVRDFQDLEAQYHRRPSAWVKPLGDWGSGAVQLVEIPSDSEANDNIVAYWSVKDGLRAGDSLAYAYRLTWPDTVTDESTAAQIARNAVGYKLSTDQKEIVIDFSNITYTQDLHINAGISTGDIVESRLEPYPEIGGIRAFVTFDPKDAEAAELRIQLMRGNKSAAPTWLYRWTTWDWPT